LWACPGIVGLPWHERRKASVYAALDAGANATAVCKRGQTALLMLLDTAVWEYNLTTHNELASPTHAVFNIAVKGNDRGILSLLLLPKRTFPTTSALRTGTK